MIQTTLTAGDRVAINHTDCALRHLAGCCDNGQAGTVIRVNNGREGNGAIHHRVNGEWVREPLVEVKMDDAERYAHPDGDWAMNVITAPSSLDRLS